MHIILIKSICVKLVHALQCLMPTKQQLNMWFLLRYLSSNAWPLQRYNIWEYTFSSNTFVSKSSLCSLWHIRSSQMKSKMFYLWFWRFSSAVPFYIKEKLCQTTKFCKVVHAAPMRCSTNPKREIVCVWKNAKSIIFD